MEPHVDKALQRGEPEPSPPVARDAHNTWMINHLGDEVMKVFGV